MNFWLILLIGGAPLKAGFPIFLYLPDVPPRRDGVQTDSIDSATLTTSPQKIETYFQKKSPKKALLLSILPGGGQFYTHNYLKGTVFFIAQSTMAGATIYEWILRDRAKKEGNTDNYEYFSGWLKNFYWIDGIVWTLSMADAYVSAHFYKFKEQGTLEIGFRF